MRYIFLFNRPRCFNKIGAVKSVQIKMSLSTALAKTFKDSKKKLLHQKQLIMISYDARTFYCTDP